jgi:hypothetical protein
MKSIWKWTTKEQDLRLAKDLINKYCDETGRSEVGIQEVTIIQEGSMHVERAAWVVELEEALERKYGAKVGGNIAKKVLASLITQDSTIH